MAIGRSVQDTQSRRFM